MPKKTWIRKSKSRDFLKNLKKNSMVEYLTELRVLNPASSLRASLNEPRREGGYVRLAHAREEFTAPVLTKGKSVKTKVFRQKKK